ncbi:hypothetical protein [Cellulomonas sp. P5_E12]
MRARRLVALAASALVLAGCGAGEDVPPESFASRAALPSCGELEIAQGETIPAEAWQCLDEADARAGAELVVTSPTTEGDPITTYFRVGPGIDGLEVFTDSSQDAFGGDGPAWTHQVCPDTVTSADPLGCAEA